jgi:pimeloyl-ACP methyl ester carboxylesterase
MISSSEDKLFSYFTSALEKKGYVNGLSMQMLPYDFRVISIHNPVLSQIKLSLRMMKTLFQKRSVLMGHSYGNKMVLQMLKTLNQKEKDNLIEEFISVAPPLLGSTNSLFCLTGSRSFLYFSQVVDYTGWKWLGHQFDGFNAFYSAKLLSTLDYVYDLMFYPTAINREFANFSENYSMLRESNTVSEQLLSSVHENVQEMLEGNLIKKQFGEVPEFKRNINLF